MDAYANRKGIAPSTMHFLLDGERIKEEHTPKTVKLKDLFGSFHLNQFVFQLELEDGDQVSSMP
jgi:hypothetical protein